MMDFTNIFALLQGGSQETGGFLADLWNYLNGLGLGAGELSVGGIAVALVLVWFFVRLIRTLVSILIAICILLLVLQLAGVVDASAVWETIQGWLTPAAETAAPAAN